MHVGRRIALTLLLLPLAELVAFVLVASAIGFWSAVLLAVLTSLTGLLVLRGAGQAHVQRFRSSVAQGIEFSGDASGAGLFTVLAGILLVLPGFITDLIGLLLLLPPARRAIGGIIASFVRRQQGAAPPGVVDLEPDEWRRHPQQGLPRRQRDDRPDP